MLYSYENNFKTNYYIGIVYDYPVLKCHVLRITYFSICEFVNVLFVFSLRAVRVPSLCRQINHYSRVPYIFYELYGSR